MILYNVTVNIDKEMELDWLQWMKEEHIPEVMQTGLFYQYHLYKLLVDEEGGGTNYSVQYFAKNMDQVETYLEQHVNRIMEKHNTRYKNRHASFRTVLQRVF